MSYRAIQRGLCCTIASRGNLISFICDIQAASLNLTAKLLFDQTRQPMRGQWPLSGKLRRSIATLDERRLRAVSDGDGTFGTRGGLKTFAAPAN